MIITVDVAARRRSRAGSLLWPLDHEGRQPREQRRGLALDGKTVRGAHIPNTTTTTTSSSTDAVMGGYRAAPSGLGA
jgi:hypothetical protein